jgi:hypothetical protein
LFELPLLNTVLLSSGVRLKCNKFETSKITVTGVRINVVSEAPISDSGLVINPSLQVPNKNISFVRYKMKRSAEQLLILNSTRAIYSTAATNNGRLGRLSSHWITGFLWGI